MKENRARTARNERIQAAMEILSLDGNKRPSEGGDSHRDLEKTCRYKNNAPSKKNRQAGGE